MTARFLLAGVMVTVLASGCRRTDVAEMDARDRESPLLRRAHECQQVGDLDGAIRLYEQSLQDNPRLVSAHMDLAVLLQDHRKDYMGAIYHYRRYEALRPETEKQAMIRDRIRVAEQLLVAQLLNRGDVAVSRDQQKLVAEIERLNQRLSLVEGEKAALQDQKGTLERVLADQKTETDRLRRLVDRLQLPSSSGIDTRERSVLPRLEPSGASSLTRPLAPAPAPHPIRIDPVREPPAGAASPEPVSASTRTYVVQPGDSLFRIAERVYGDPIQWKRVRDANKDRIDPEGRLRAGQVLVVPP
jgi:LysM repeat protein